ncbi:MAG: T9SS type A sorting domain-containing protein [Sphingobacteriaceae bacterium]|nr:T9SS type A sorting domain-containing protein [Sphingobacteriaceae bacterium]
MTINVVQSFNESEKQSVEITIFDITGKEILKENRLLDDGDEIRMSQNLLNGTYLVKVKLQDGSTDVHRLIIDK